MTTTKDNVPQNAGAIFGIIAKLYQFLPRVFRHSSKIAHYTSVYAAKLMPSGRAIVNTPGGRMCIVPRHPADLQRAWGAWEIDLQSCILKTLKPGNVFIDCGAHRGTYTTMASNLVGPAGQVVSIEPFQEHFECLTFTAEQSRHKNIKLIQAACSSISGTVLFSEKECHVDDVGEAISCIALDDVVPRADFIKIDTDGRELDVIRGAKKLIQDGTQIIVEFSDFAYQPLDRLWVETKSFMSDLGCHAYVIRKDGSIGSEVSNIHEIKDRHILFRKATTPLENAK